MTYEDLEKLDILRQKGIITDAEYEAQKRKFFEHLHAREEQEREREKFKQEEQQRREEAERQKQQEQANREHAHSNSQNKHQNSYSENHTNFNFSNLGGYKNHWGMEEKTFCMVLHLGIFAGYLIPIAGWVLPLIMWLTEKDRSPRINAHGTVVMNWLITYAIATVILALIPILGWIIAGAAMVLNIIFAIIGAVNASEGKLYRYPLSFQFIS